MVSLLFENKNCILVNIMRIILYNMYECLLELYRTTATTSINSFVHIPYKLS